MSPEQIRRAVREFTGPNGWWNSRNEDTYVVLAERLIDQGVVPDEALDILSQAHAATCDEYGA